MAAARSVAWVDVLPSMAQFATNMTRGVNRAARTAGTSAGRTFTQAVNTGARSAAGGPSDLVHQLEENAKRAARAVQNERGNIARARAAERSATESVAAAEAALAAQRTKIAAANTKVTAAESNLAGMRTRVEATSLKVLRAEAALTDAVQQYGVGSAKAIQAENSLVTARDRHTTASTQAVRAEEQLLRAQASGQAAASAALRSESTLTTARDRAEAAAGRTANTVNALRAAQTESNVVTQQLAEAQTTANGTSSRLQRTWGRLATAGEPLANGLTRVAGGVRRMAVETLASLKPLAGMAAGFASIVGIGKVISLGNEYTATMNELQAVSGLTDQQMVKVGKTARALGSDIALPATSGKDAAAVMLELSKGGLTAAQSMEAARGTIVLAAAAQVDGARAAEIQSNAINQFGLKAKDASMVADVLANTANAAAGGVDDIATSMKYVGPVARTLGISIGDTASAIGMLANNGLKGDTAGTALRGMLASLSAPSDHAAMAIEELGITAFDSQGNFVGMREVIDQLSSAQKRMTKQNFATYAAIAFGREPLAAVSALASSGADAYDTMTKSVTKNGGAAEVAQSKMRGLGGAMDKLGSQLEDIALGIYEQVTPYLEGSINGIAGFLDGAGGKIDSFLAKAGALGKLAMGGAQPLPALQGMDPKVIQGITEARKIVIASFRDISTFVTTGLIPSLKNLAIALGPLAAILAGAFVGALRVAAYLLANVVGPALVAVTGFLRDHQGVVLLAAAAVGVLVGAYKAQQLALAILNAGGILNYLRLTPLVTAATLGAKRAQEGYALATYGVRAALQAQGIAGAAGVAALYARNAAIRVGAALQFTMVAATRGWTYALMLSRGAALTNAGSTTVATSAQWAFNAALSANPIGLVIIAILAVAAVLAALVAGVIYAYNHWTWFRTAVDAVWSAILVGIKAVGAAAVWLWKSVFVPAWQGIAAGATWLWTNAIAPVFAWIAGAARTVGDAAVWLWRTVFLPALQGIGNAALWLWTNAISPTFTFIGNAARGVASVIVSSIRSGIAILVAIGNAVAYVYSNYIDPIFQLIGAIIRFTVGVAFLWLYNSVVKPVFTWIAAAVTVWWTTTKAVFAIAVSFVRDALGAIFLWLWNSVISPVLGWIATKVTWWWTMTKIGFSMAVSFVRDVLGAVFLWIWRSVISPVLGWIVSKVTWWWNMTKAGFNLAVSFIRNVLGTAFTWLYSNIVKPVFDKIGAVARGVWDGFLKPVFSKIADFAKNTIPDAFRKMSDGIGKAWQFVKDAAKAPIRFVINTIVNDGLIGNFNKVATLFGTKKMPEISLPRGFAGGGVIPGYQSAKRDDQLRPMRSGEGVLVPEVVRALGPGFVHGLNRAGNSGGVRAVRNMAGYAKGGIVGAVTSGWDWVKGTAGKAWDWGKNAAETAAGVVADPVGTLGKLVNSAIKKIPGGDAMVNLAGGMGHKMLDGVIGLVKKIAATADTGGANGKLPRTTLAKVSGFTGGPGVGELGGYLRRSAARAWEAMQTASGGALTLTEGYRDMANQQKRWAMYKAGGNLAATPGTSVHGLGNAADIGAGQAWARANGARYGWLPTGLSFSQREPWHFEYKGGTKAPGYSMGGIIPKAKDAAKGYALGGIFGEPTLYDNGGYLPTGRTVVENRTGRPEPVFTSEQFAAMREGREERSEGDTTIYATVGGTGDHHEDMRDLRRAVRAGKNGVPV